jgi:hypothetical protein
METAGPSSSSMGGQAQQTAPAPISSGAGVSSKGRLEREWDGELGGYVDWEDFAWLATLRQVAGGQVTVADLLYRYGLCIRKGSMGRAIYDAAVPIVLQLVDKHERGEKISFTAFSVPLADSMLNMAPLDTAPAAAAAAGPSFGDGYALLQYTLDAYPGTNDQGQPADLQERVEALMRLPCLPERLAALREAHRLCGFSKHAQLERDLELAIGYRDGGVAVAVSAQPQLPEGWTLCQGVITSKAGRRLPQAYAPLFAFWATMARYCNRVTAADVDRVRCMAQWAGESPASWGVRLQAAVDRVNTAAEQDPTVEYITSTAAGILFLEGLTKVYSELAQQQAAVITGMGHGQRTVQRLVACLTTAWQGQGELASEGAKLKAVRGLALPHKQPGGKSVSWQDQGGRPPNSHAEVRRLVEGLSSSFARTAASSLQKKMGWPKGSGKGGPPPAGAAMAAGTGHQGASWDWGGLGEAYPAAMAAAAGGGAGWYGQQQMWAHDHHQGAAEAPLQLGWHDSMPPFAASAAAAGGGGAGRGHSGGRGPAAGRGPGPGAPQGTTWRPCGCSNPIHPVDRVCYTSNPRLAPLWWQPRCRADLEVWERYCRQDGIALPGPAPVAGAGRGGAAGGSSGGGWGHSGGGGSSGSGGGGRGMGRGGGAPGRTPFP